AALAKHDPGLQLGLGELASYINDLKAVCLLLAGSQLTLELTRSSLNLRPSFLQLVGGKHIAHRGIEIFSPFGKLSLAQPCDKGLCLLLKIFSSLIYFFLSEAKKSD